MKRVHNRTVCEKGIEAANKGRLKADFDLQPYCNSRTKRSAALLTRMVALPSRISTPSAVREFVKLLRILVARPLACSATAALS
jgi:hypothetical protein